MCGITARALKTCAITFTSQQRSHSDVGVCSSPSTAMPALEQKRSIRPCRPMTCATSRATSASRETSTATAVPRISSATCAAPRAFTSATTTAFAPSAANRRHSARPMPSAPPVTTTTLSATITPDVSRMPPRKHGVFSWVFVLSWLTANGESLASHRDGRGAPMARRDDREYREYLSEEQRSQRGPQRGSRVGVERGCIARRMQPDFRHGLLTQREPADRVVGEVDELDYVFGNFHDAVARRHVLAFLDDEQLSFAGDEGGAHGAVGASVLAEADELHRRLRGRGNGGERLAERGAGRHDWQCAARSAAWNTNR